MLDPWLREKSRVALSGNLQSKKVVDQFRGFRNESRMKKMALTVIASQLPAEQVSELKTLFEQLDGNGDGTLTYTEKAFEAIDSDKSGKIDYTEFIAATMDKALYISE